MTKVIDEVRKKLNDTALPWALKKRFGPGTVNVAASRYVSLFPNLNLAFNRVKKNGNSTTMSLLYAMEMGEMTKPHKAKRYSTNLRTVKMPLLMNASDLYHFVIVRDPYSRTLSAFLNKFNKPDYIERFGSFALTSEGFHQFLIWLSDRGLEDDAHWDLQKKLIVGPIEDFDAVLRFEEFPECLEALLLSRGLKLPSMAEKIFGSVHQDTRTGAIRKLQEFYTPESVALVRALYREDFEFLDYSTEFGGPNLEGTRTGSEQV